MFSHVRSAVFSVLAVSTLALFAGVSAAGGGAIDPSRTGQTTGIHDEAGLFKSETVKAVDRELERIESKYHVPILIETVEALHGRAADEVAKENARRLNSRGIYILIDKKDRKFEMIVPPSVSRVIPHQAQTRIRDAFLDRFKKSDFDDGLREGVREIERLLASSKTEATTPSTPSTWPGLEAPGGATLVVRNQVKLTLTGARRIIAGAEGKATAMGLKMNIAIVDDGGHLLAFARMDGARPASGYTAITKATTAATFRQETGPLPKGTTTPDLLLNLSLQNAAAASGGKVTTLLGGVPVLVDGQVIGGVGVGGGSGDQDAEVAKAGVSLFLSEMNPAPKKEEAAAREPETKNAR
jgi:glc operon protein GlcG